ncbi:hypothetical protein LUZ60_008801 [Juncus effusus]|nr:hypothetical protein LUZ60_008801 [Juncus effusus]
MEREDDQLNWAELNGDILLLIFQKLVTIDVLMSGVVCRSWRKVAKDEPELWRRIDMRKLASGRTEGRRNWRLMELARIAIDRSKGNVEQFWIQYFGGDDLLKYLCGRTSVLKSLRLIACLDISDEEIVETVKKQLLLEELQIASEYFEDLPELAEEEYEDEEKKMMKKKKMKMKKKKLDCRISNNSNWILVLCILLLMMTVTNRGLTAILKGCPFLETLDIRECYYGEMDSDMRARFARIKTVRLPLDSLDDYEYEAEVRPLDDNDSEEEERMANYSVNCNAFYASDCDFY